MTAEKMLDLVEKLGLLVTEAPNAWGLFHIGWLVGTALAIILALQT